MSGGRTTKENPLRRGHLLRIRTNEKTDGRGVDARFRYWGMATVLYDSATYTLLYTRQAFGDSLKRYLPFSDQRLSESHFFRNYDATLAYHFTTNTPRCMVLGAWPNLLCQYCVQGI